MKHRILAAALVALCLAAGPATRPATTAPLRVRDGLVNGAVRFLVPADWELISRTDNGFSVTYHTPDGIGAISILITQEQEAIPQHNALVRAQMQKAVLGWDNEDLQKRKVEVIDAPMVEPDDRFMLRVHERYKDEEQHPLDVIHIYRGIGLNLVGVMVAASTQDKAQAKKIHDSAALMLMSVNLGPPDPRIVRPIPKKE